MIRLALRVRRADAELVLAELLELAPGGVEEVDIDPGTVEYAVYGAPGELPELPALRVAAGRALVELRSTEVADDWAERWREFHRPVLVEPPAGTEVPALRVRPPWEPPAAAPHTIELVIDPGQAFGTGAHATTRLCLALLLELRAEAPPAAAVLDIGTGSGVLAIAVAKRLHARVVASDIDRVAVDAARNNARLNHAPRITFVHAPGASARAIAAHGPFDLILANILLGPLTRLAVPIRRLAAPHARVVLSGLLPSHANAALAHYAAQGFRLERRIPLDGWMTLVLTRGRCVRGRGR